MQPSGVPSVEPTPKPSTSPSAHPSASPSSDPTSQPSSQPSASPSASPTARPSLQPSYQPSAHPTSRPSVHPSASPTSRPSVWPSIQPSSQPTGGPSVQPSPEPSGKPSLHPSPLPSIQPSSQPTNKPSLVPSPEPSMTPSGQPTSSPSLRPSPEPSMMPSGQPTSPPSLRPSPSPSVSPSSQPTPTPSWSPSFFASNPPSESLFPTVSKRRCEYDAHLFIILYLSFPLTYAYCVISLLQYEKDCDARALTDQPDGYQEYDCSANKLDSTNPINQCCEQSNNRYSCTTCGSCAGDNTSGINPATPGQILDRENSLNQTCCSYQQSGRGTFYYRNGTATEDTCDGKDGAVCCKVGNGNEEDDYACFDSADLDDTSPDGVANDDNCVCGFISVTKNHNGGECLLV